MTTLIPQETWNAVLDEVAEEVLEGAEVTTPRLIPSVWQTGWGLRWRSMSTSNPAADSKGSPTDLRSS
jgi:hypothetical protein